MEGNNFKDLLSRFNKPKTEKKEEPPKEPLGPAKMMDQTRLRKFTQGKKTERPDLSKASEESSDAPKKFSQERLRTFTTKNLDKPKVEETETEQKEVKKFSNEFMSKFTQKKEDKNIPQQPGYEQGVKKLAGHILDKYSGLNKGEDKGTNETSAPDPNEFDSNKFKGLLNRVKQLDAIQQEKLKNQPEPRKPSMRTKSFRKKGPTLQYDENLPFSYILCDEDLCHMELCI